MSAATGTSSNFNVQAMPSLPSSCYPPSPSTADPCPPQPPPLSPGEIASIAVEGMTLVAIVSAATASVVLGAFWIRRRRKKFKRDLPITYYLYYYDTITYENSYIHAMNACSHNYYYTLLSVSFCRMNSNKLQRGSSFKEGHL